MSITIFSPTSGGNLGAGFSISWGTSLVGPFPPGTQWIITLEDRPPGEAEYGSWFYPCTGSIGTGIWQFDVAANDWRLPPPQQEIIDGALLQIKIELQEPDSTIIDTGTQTIVQDSVSGTAYVAARASTGVTGGFTDTDRANLVTTQDNTETLKSNWDGYTSVTLPSLQDMLNNIIGGITATITTVEGDIGKTLGDLFSGRTFDGIGTYLITDGIICEPFSYTLDRPWVYGLFVGCTTIPDYFARSTPDDQRYQPALVDVNIRRGDTILLSKAMHYAQEGIYPLPMPEYPITHGVAALPLAAPDFHFDFFPATGVCYFVRLMVFP